MATPPEEEIRKSFPLLRGREFQVTSPCTATYNCIAWAAGVDNRWWDPFGKAHWPKDAPRQGTVEAYCKAFETIGYQVCSDGKTEGGFEKMALFAKVPAMVPTHAARQLPDGKWTSKLGKSWDIAHDLSDLDGTIYGTVVCFMKRANAKL